ncbi:MAG: ATP-binding cassette domain-containing protein [Actinophytocola sp.]|nr:ABC transporter ATP-binding protein [Actinophytocola sp.]MPZ80353.1 ATP-binding cassette domain-containing protein [Actinophytocola sp.]
MLRTRGLSKEFNGFRAVNDVDLSVEAGTVHALVGPNGAGKTTLFNLLTGFLKPSGGTISIDGHDVTGMRPERIAQRGVARSFQITSLFEELTLAQHVELALLGRDGEGYRFWRSDKRLRRYRAETERLLEQVGLAGRAGVTAGSLAYGQKRALELALALALSPRLLLLDEPTAGMGVEDVTGTIELIQRVREDRTVVLVEHNMKVVGDLTDRVTVLQFGKILAEGSYEQVRGDPHVITAYLGESVSETGRTSARHATRKDGV